jgi:hypothetical protein
MARARWRLNATAVALSIAAHAVVLTALALHAPKLAIPREEAGPPEPIIPILIMPRTPPAPPGATQKPPPIRLHRRQLRPGAPPPNVAPFIPPEETATPAPPSHAPAQPPITVQPSPGAQLSTTLRGGLVGCANSNLLAPAERERCLEQLGRGAHEAPYQPPAIEAAKQAGFDRAAQARERARQAGAPTGSAAPSAGSGAGYRNKPLEPPPPPPLPP